MTNLIYFVNIGISWSGLGLSVNKIINTWYTGILWKTATFFAVLHAYVLVTYFMDNCDRIVLKNEVKTVFNGFLTWKLIYLINVYPK